MSHRNNLPPDFADGNGHNRRTYTSSHTNSDGRLPSQSVFEAVAEATDKSPEQLQPIYESIDPDALDRIFAPPSGRTHQEPTDYVSFRYEGCEVTVYADGRTVVSLDD